MVKFDGKEAVLFRILVSFFGEDRVIPHMSLAAACGGSLPQSLDLAVSAEVEKGFSQPIDKWARESKCLFTVVNQDDDPRLVIEFVGSFNDIVDGLQIQRQGLMRPVLAAAGVPYVTVNEAEFSDLTKPADAVSIFHFLESKLESQP